MSETPSDKTAMELAAGAAISVREDRNLTISEIKNNVERVRALLKSVMVGPQRIEEGPDKGKMSAGVHYGTIPGTPKPTLFQPGAELIAMMFRLELFPIVEDLSTTDVIRYRVKTQIKHQTTGLTIGWGIGEASSDEDKYRWRRAVVDAEWEMEDPARRRVKWFKGRGNGGAYQIKQVRTNPADLANTILKMATKRSKVGGVREATAASDVFDVGAEDLDETLRASIYGDDGGGAEEPRQQPGKKAEEPPQQQATTPPGELSGKLVGEAPLRILRLRLSDHGKTEEQLCEEFKIKALAELPFEWVNKAMEWVAKK